jgi:hypothetical protein
VSRISTTPVEWTPELGSRLTVWGSATDHAWEWNDWVEVMASAPANVYIVGAEFSGQSNHWWELEFGVGAAGAEVPMGRLAGAPNAPDSGQWPMMPAPVPFRVTTAAGNRLAVRGRTSGFLQANYWRIAYLAGPDHTTITTQLPFALPASGNQLTLTRTGSAWGQTAYGELSAGLANAAGLAGLIVNPNGVTNQNEAHEIDIAVGAAGSEAVIATFRVEPFSYYTNGWMHGILPVLVRLPASTRVAARMRALNTTVAGIPLKVFVYGAEVEPPPPPTEIEFDPDSDVTGETVGLTWVELRDDASGLHVSSKVPLPDPSAYYGGWKEPDVVEWGLIRRACSDWKGNYEGTSFRWAHSDTGQAWRDLLADDETRQLLNSEVVIRMISDEERRMGGLARTIVRGVVRGYKPLSPLQFEFRAEDTLTRLFTKEVPYRRIVAADFPDAVITDANGVQTNRESVGKGVPIVYGNMSDEQSTTSQGTHLDAPTVLGVTCPTSGSATKRYAVTFLNADYGPPYDRPWSDHRGETEPTWVTVNNAPTDDQMRADPWGARIVIRMAANQAGIAGGRQYGRYPDRVEGLDGIDSPGAFGVVPSDEWQAWDGVRPHGAPDFNSLHGEAPPTTNNTGGTTVDTGKGAIKPLYVGRLMTHHCWVVAAHACKAITSWYVDGVRQPESTAALDPLGPWAIPGYSGYTLPTPYLDINGRRYTVIFGRVGYTEPDECAAGTRTLTCNVEGIETVGDGSGTLITDALDQYEHFLANWAFGDYQSGAWLEAPLFPPDPAPENEDVLHMISHDSFVAAKAVAARRIGGGYVGAGIITGPIKLVDIVARWNRSCDVDCGFNRKTQFAVWMEDDDEALLAAARHYTQERDIFAGSFDIEDVESELFNEIPYCYAHRPADDSWGTDTRVSDTVSIAELGETRTADRLELHFVRSAAVAQDIVNRVLARRAYPPREVKFRVGLSGLNSELGDIVLVTHADGIGEAGWAEHPVRVRAHEVNPEDFTVTITARDVGHIFRRATDTTWMQPPPEDVAVQMQGQAAMDVIIGPAQRLFAGFSDAGG